jgi:GAF domain-containing protein
VPVGAGRPLVSRAVANAFASLDASSQHARLERELSELNAIGIQLSAERNLDVLLETILTKAREITGSDAGSLYLVEDAPDGERRLRFTLAQNESVEIPFRSVTLPLDGESVAGHVALTGSIVNLADAYAPPEGSPFKINRWFDEHARYRTKSMLVVPLRTPQGEIIGALQLINCKPERRGPLRTTEEAEVHVRPYGDRHVRLAGSLASQAAVALANRRLYESISQLFDGFVKASVTAIESRDPHHLRPLLPRGGAHGGPGRGGRARRPGRLPRRALQRRGAARAALRRPAARLRQGRRARARAGEIQEALSGGPRAHPAPDRAAHRATWSSAWRAASWTG